MGGSREDKKSCGRWDGSREDKSHVGDGMGARKIKVKVKIKEWVCGVHISLLKMFCHIRN